jgi:hypothetical protein
MYHQESDTPWYTYLPADAPCSGHTLMAHCPLPAAAGSAAGPAALSSAPASWQYWVQFQPPPGSEPPPGGPRQPGWYNASSLPLWLVKAYLEGLKRLEAARAAQLAAASMQQVSARGLVCGACLLGRCWGVGAGGMCR